MARHMRTPRLDALQRVINTKRSSVRVCSDVPGGGDGGEGDGGPVGVAGVAADARLGDGADEGEFGFAAGFALVEADVDCGG